MIHLFCKKALQKRRYSANLAMAPTKLYMLSYPPVSHKCFVGAIARFAEYRLFCRAFLQKRRIFLRSYPILQFHTSAPTFGNAIMPSTPTSLTFTLQLFLKFPFCRLNSSLLLVYFSSLFSIWNFFIQAGWQKFSRLVWNTYEWIHSWEKSNMNTYEYKFVIHEYIWIRKSYMNTYEYKVEWIQSWDKSYVNTYEWIHMNEYM